MSTVSLDTAARALGGALVGPREIAAALGFDPGTVLAGPERAVLDTVPFAEADLARAKASDEMLVLRLSRSPDGPLSIVGIAARLGGGIDPRAHKGVGYSLRDEWTIDEQPFATRETCPVGWQLVRRSPLPATCNRAYRRQDDILGATGGPPLRRRSAVEIAWDTLLWHRAHGERLLASAWDWSCSPSTDGGFAALGEFSDQGLRVVAYSRAVLFGTLGICPQR